MLLKTPIQRLAWGLLILGICATCASGAFATALPITDSGVLAISNVGGSLVGITTTPSFCVNWGGGSTCVAGTTHQMTVSGVSNLFSTSTSATDQIKDLTGTGALTSFETVLGAGALAGQTIIFDLTSIPTNGAVAVGNCGSNAAFNTCTPAFSPFTFSEDSTGTQVSISFSTLMNAFTGSSATGVTGYRGVFTTQVSGTLTGSGACVGLAANITNILSCEAAGGTVSSTWSATESPIPGTPEPASLMLFGSGLMGLAAFRRRIFGK